MDILDNKKDKKVGEILRKSIKKDAKLSILSAYFTIYAYSELKKELSQIENMRFLFLSPTFNKDEKDFNRREFFIDKRERERNILGDFYEIKLKNNLTSSGIAKGCANWIRNKVEVKSLKDPNIADMRMMCVENRDKKNNVVVSGNSDFNSTGLGFINSKKMYMNSCMDEEDKIREMVKRFDEIWNDDDLVIEVKKEVLEQIETVYKENSPEFLYFITLYNIFKEYLENLTEDEIVKTKTGFKETNIFKKLYKFQRDGVIGAIDKIEKYNGCIIADSVGLGKTFEALAIIKYYELRNDRVLVLCPKKLRDNWTIYTQNDKRNILAEDRFNYDVLNHTDLDRNKGLSGDINLETINWGNYDLIVIDVSHNFRNHEARVDKETRYSKLMNRIIKAGVKTKVLMLSATPLNNKMTDLKNQIAFITEGNDKALIDEEIKSIENTLKKAQTVFNRWLELKEEERTLENFLENINLDYFKLLDVLTIARSRKHIQKYYNMDEIGNFPERLKPINVKSNIDIEDKLKIEKVNNEIASFNLALYSPIKYIYPTKQQEYSEKYDREVKGGASKFRQADREQSNIGLIRVNLLKRMESSIYSFTLTLERTFEKIDRCLEKIDNFKEEDFVDISIEDVSEDDEELEDVLIGENKIKVLMQDIDLVKWREDLLRDKQKIAKLLEHVKKIDPEKDAKLLDLKNRIKEKIENPFNDNNKKVLVFTAFADTAKYLYENISPWIQKEYDLNVALVTGSSSNQTTMKLKNSDFNSILMNFSPVSKERNKINENVKEEIDILIATDCISEGQNLQDCDCMVNYDIHWNPVRIIQRFGRIDRIGSRNKQIKLINFWPKLELDAYINLEKRVKGRMMILDVSATGEENLITEKDGMNDLTYRKKQLEKIKEEIIDIEDVSGSISITDLNFNDFRMDLMDYSKEHEKDLKRAPLGMYALSKKEDNIQKGVIFCFKQVNKKIEPQETNPLYPYYLMYINNNGEVLCNYLQTKKILDIFRKLSKGRIAPDEDLVNLFNKETKEAMSMEKYSDLLKKAIINILDKKEEKQIETLFSTGGTSSVKNNLKELEDFELISFLIIK